jgi:hypothetical protein
MGCKGKGECMKNQAVDYKQTTINSKSYKALLTLQLIKRHPNKKEIIESAEREEREW